VVLVLIWLIVFFRNEYKGIGELSHRNWIFLGISGLATGLSWIFYFKALQKGEVSKVAGVDKLSLAVTIILAILFLGETLTWKTSVGAVLIIAGTLFLISK
jgi:transporter family protein